MKTFQNLGMFSLNFEKFLSEQILTNKISAKPVGRKIISSINKIMCIQLNFLFFKY